MSDAGTSSCGASSPYNGSLNLRVASVFIVLVTSGTGALLPIVFRRSRFAIPEAVYEAFKYAGSGIIIATAFIHLLAPAFEALGSDCLHGAWSDYDWAPAIAMMSVFAIFLVELIATRAGSSFLAKRGLAAHDPHKSRGNDTVSHTGHGTHAPSAPVAGRGPLAEAGEAAAGTGGIEELAVGGGVLTATTTAVEGLKPADDVEGDKLGADDVESGSGGHGHSHGAADDHETIDESAMAQILGVAILEFGVLFHSFIIGLTLAVSNELGTLLAVIIFHQTFEGLGLGSRLCVLPLPSKYNYVPFLAAVIYACTTPLGIAVGLGIRHTYNPESIAASIVSGILDSTSAGILIWAGVVECLAHDFVFDRKMAEASNRHVAISVFWVLLGAGLMALLGRWA